MSYVGPGSKFLQWLHDALLGRSNVVSAADLARYARTQGVPVMVTPGVARVGAPAAAAYAQSQGIPALTAAQIAAATTTCTFLGMKVPCPTPQQIAAATVQKGNAPVRGFGSLSY